MAPLITIVFLLMGGFYVQTDNIPSYFKWVESISYLKYAYRALMVNEFSGLSLSCSAGPCYSSGEEVLGLYGMQTASVAGDLLILVAIIVALKGTRLCFPGTRQAKAQNRIMQQYKTLVEAHRTQQYEAALALEKHFTQCRDTRVRTQAHLVLAAAAAAIEKHQEVARLLEYILHDDTTATKTHKIALKCAISEPRETETKVKLLRIAFQSCLISDMQIKDVKNNAIVVVDQVVKLNNLSLEVKLDFITENLKLQDNDHGFRDIRIGCLLKMTRHLLKNEENHATIVKKLDQNLKKQAIDIDDRFALIFKIGKGDHIEWASLKQVIDSFKIENNCEFSNLEMFRLFKVFIDNELRLTNQKDISGDTADCILSLFKALTCKETSSFHDDQICSSYYDLALECSNLYFKLAIDINIISEGTCELFRWMFDVIPNHSQKNALSKM